MRDLVIGKENRAATPDELARMEAAVAQAMEDGAFGLSTSLIYVPDSFASTEEIIALAKVAARYGGSYITHQRDEGDELNGPGIDGSLDEVFRIAREARIPAEIYHLKASARRSWGRMPAILARIEKAARRGARRHGGPVPLDGQLERPLRVTPRVGARGRQREARGAAAGSGRPRAHPS